jgi:hypothetical protein
MKIAPARASAARCVGFTARQRSCAGSNIRKVSTPLPSRSLAAADDCVTTVHLHVHLKLQTVFPCLPVTCDYLYVIVGMADFRIMKLLSDKYSESTSCRLQCRTVCLAAGSKPGRRTDRTRTALAITLTCRFFEISFLVCWFTSRRFSSFRVFFGAHVPSVCPGCSAPSWWCALRRAATRSKRTQPSMCSTAG